MSMDVHPFAAVFPMMADEELADLAADIKENGLLHPIVVDSDGMLIDGRNRKRACEIAGVEPRYEQLNGRDAAAFIVSANLARRNLSKSQQAMALAMIYPDAEIGRPQKGKSLSLPKSERVLLSMARMILRHSKTLAEDVLHRGKHFDVALQEAKAAEQERKSHDAQLTQLRAKAPDVAAMVEDGRLTIQAGLAELSERQRFVQRTIADGRAAAARFVGLAAQLTVIKLAADLGHADLALIETDAADADPLADLPEKEIAALANTAGELLRMKGG